MSKQTIIQGDCLEEMKKLPDNSVDSIVTDPPYGISFMGKKWDYDVPKVEVWQEAMRVLKPGGHILVACGTRTQHRMAVNIEDAGFEIRDIVAWIYGSGFPKSLNIGKAVDKLQGNEREVIKRTRVDGKKPGKVITGFGNGDPQWTDKGTSEWEGWGTALKPAMELWTLARKPLSEKTVAENVLKWGTGGLNIDESRVEGKVPPTVQGSSSDSGIYNHNKAIDGRKEIYDGSKGRFPANLIHDGSDEVVGMFPDNHGHGSTKHSGSKSSLFGNGKKVTVSQSGGEGGSAARFFYTAKASKAERNRGLEGMEEKEVRGGGGRARHGYDDTEEQQRLRKVATAYGAVKAKKANTHPTVKPISLMKYLIKLVTPPGGTVLDPFVGSGSTAVASKELGFNCIGIEREEEYCEIARKRIYEIQTPIL